MSGSRFAHADLEAGGLDRLDVAAARDRARDARGPEVDVPPGPLLERPAADDVGERQPAPGPSTRAASAKTRSFAGERLITPLEMTASKLASSNGSSSILRLDELDLREAVAEQASALPTCSSVKSTPTTRPDSPTSMAAQKTSVPEPEPRSSTFSPGRSAARSRRCPTPANEARASAGSRPAARRVTEMLGEGPADLEAQPRLVPASHLAKHVLRPRPQAGPRRSARLRLPGEGPFRLGHLLGLGHRGQSMPATVPAWLCCSSGT